MIIEKQNADKAARVEYSKRTIGHEEHYALRVIGIKGCYESMKLDVDTLVLLKQAIDEALIKTNPRLDT